ncbi:MAG: hypothetical protein RIE08_12055 [Acidimicrobiales bacterium]
MTRRNLLVSLVAIGGLGALSVFGLVAGASPSPEVTPVVLDVDDDVPAGDDVPSPEPGAALVDRPAVAAGGDDDGDDDDGPGDDDGGGFVGGDDGDDDDDGFGFVGRDDDDGPADDDDDDVGDDDDDDD